MSALLIWYPKCSTCQKANKWLEEHGIDCEKRHIVEENPTAAELQEWVERSGKPSKSFFNTSGNLYKELGLKDKLPDMDDRQRFELLAHQRPCWSSAPSSSWGMWCWWASSRPSGKPHY